jgi:bifunctional non-homologous end joining protein LigD
MKHLLLSKKKEKNMKIKKTHQEKIFFPQTKKYKAITKQDMFNYYEASLPALMPYAQNRILTMHRFPDGIAGTSFFQKHVPAYFPDFIERKDSYLVCNSKETFMYVIATGCITPHASLSLSTTLEFPDQIIFDLDPAENMVFQEIKKLALILKDILAADGLESFVMTTGSRGLHVRVPIKPVYSFDQTRAYALVVAKKITAQAPDLYTVQMRKQKRGSCIYIDTMRNAQGATAVLPYALRALPGAPLAMPLYWHELEDSNLNAQSFVLETSQERIKDNKAWNGMLGKQQLLPRY